MPVCYYYALENYSAFTYIMGNNSNDDLIIRSQQGIFGLYPMNSAFYKLGNDICRTVYKNEGKAQ